MAGLFGGWVCLGGSNATARAVAHPPDHHHPQACSQCATSLVTRRKKKSVVVTVQRYIFFAAAVEAQGKKFAMVVVAHTFFSRDARGANFAKYCST